MILFAPNDPLQIVTNFKTKLNYVLISLSLKSNYDVIIFTVVSYFPCLLLGDLKLAELGSTNENSAPPDGTKLKNSIKIIE